ncbi:DoxX family protein [Nocardia paucivorans]|uniref:DoxX family protein n=1 Tax=Nocardia paucivorans TaxID=114259 RepID=UPI00031F02F2|nr:DoxX family protein [Nocardia paucivorans]
MTANTTVGRTRTSTTTSADIGLLVLRVVFGGLLAGHGSQKLFGWFDGPGLEANNAGFEQMGYNPGDLFGTLAGLSEFVGGLLLLAGLLSPLAAAIVLGTTVNIVNQTWSGGLLTGEGYEMGLLYAAAAFTVACTGPGRLSLDFNRPWVRGGYPWAAGAIVLGVVSGVFVLILKAVL